MQLLDLLRRFYDLTPETEMLHVFLCGFKRLICLQVFPGAWTAVLVSLDNAGMWNLRIDNLASWYLGQELYLSVVNPEIDIDSSENSVPKNSIYCGRLSPLQKDQAQRVNFSGSQRSIFVTSRGILLALFAILVSSLAR
jgi:hypothetical protein